jgi:hypothetical protein
LVTTGPGLLIILVTSTIFIMVSTGLLMKRLL